MSDTLNVDFTNRNPEIWARPLEETPDGAAIGNILNAEQQEHLRGIATLQSYSQRKGIIFSEGSEATFVYLVVSGVVRVSRCCKSSRQQVLALMMAGDMFGFPEQGIYVNSARSIGDVWLYRMTWWRLQELMRREPNLQSAILTRMAFDLRRAQEHIILLGQQNVVQRLVSFLLDLMRQQEFFNAERMELTLPLSRFDLAEYLGTRPETLVRAVAWLESKGLVRRNSARNLTIASAEALDELLDESRRRH